MEVIPGNAQHIGARGSQQDAFGFSNLANTALRAHGGVLMVLCDGMGGLAKGDEAAGAAVQAVLASYARKLPDEAVPAALERALFDAQKAVRAVAADGPNAGTTIVAAVILRDQLFWASLGDSRLYLCRGKDPAQQLTQDHNVAALLAVQVERGEISAQDAAEAPDREALTGYLGSPYPPQPHICRAGLALRPGDRIMACSDGVYRALSPQALAETGAKSHPMAAAEAIRDAVLAQALPHQDNLTVTILDIRAPEAAPAPLWRQLPLMAAAAALLLALAGAAGAAWYFKPWSHQQAPVNPAPAPSPAALLVSKPPTPPIPPAAPGAPATAPFTQPGSFTPALPLQTPPHNPPASGKILNQGCPLTKHYDSSKKKCEPGAPPAHAAATAATHST